jgi:hypothetical protein
MAMLGLLPPYTAEDVRMAYRERAMRAHPDHGGSVREFVNLQEAYARAVEYTSFCNGRRQWLAAQVDRYAHQEQVIAEIKLRGGDVEVEEIDWLKQSIGEDFATLADRLRGIRAQRQPDGDHLMHQLGAHMPGLGFVLWIDVADSRVTDEGLGQLAGLALVERLDLSGTWVTEKGLSVVGSLPNLRWLNLADTRLRWWKRWRLYRSYPKLKIVARRHLQPSLHK